MSGLSTSSMLDIVKEITIAQIANSAPVLPDSEPAKGVAAYMQVIYEKLEELESKHRETRQSNR